MEKKTLMKILKMLKHQQQKNHGHAFVAEVAVIFVQVMPILFHRITIKEQQLMLHHQQHHYRHQRMYHFMMFQNKLIIIQEHLVV